MNAKDRGIDERWQRMNRLAGLCHPITGLGIIIGRKQMFSQMDDPTRLIRLGNALAKHLFPSSLHLATLLLPSLCQIRLQLFLMSLQIVHQVSRYRTVPCLIGRCGIVARCSLQSRLILNLNHDDRMPLIDLCHMLHELGKSLGISLQDPIITDRKHLQFLALGIDSPRKTFRVLLDPRRRIGHKGVLECSEPEQHQLHVMLFSPFNQRIGQGKVVRSFDRFKLLPRDGRDQGVQMHIGQLLEDLMLIHIRHRRGGRVMQFTTIEDKRFALNHQTRFVSHLLENGKLSLTYPTGRQPAKQQQQSFHVNFHLIYII